MNEETVIGQLVESIRAQDYPSELVSIFVVADNCTDNTEIAARELGAIVYRRENREKIGKGYALEFLLQCIERDGYMRNVDAFIVLDADNILDSEYVRAMNQMLCDGYNVSTSYRNSKNYCDNWLSAAYALWFMRTHYSFLLLSDFRRSAQTRESIK